MMRARGSASRMILFCLLCLILVPEFKGQSAPAVGGAAMQEKQQGLALKAEARQVIVDVVVTTDRDQPVKRLSKDVFRVTEEGKPQQITFFEEHGGVSPESVRKSPPEPLNVYSNIPESPVTDSINVLLLDALNTPAKDQAYVRQQMVSYLKSIPPGTRLAIFTLSSRLRMIQSFTSDSALLIEALKTKKSLPRNSSLLDTAAEAEQQDTMESMLSEAGLASSLALLQQFEADTQSFQTDMRVRYTLEALQQLGRYLGGIPGRKNIIWFSGSFPLGILPDSTVLDSFNAVRNYSGDVKKTTDLLTSGQIAIYPVDARGLMSMPMFDASTTGAKYARTPAALGQDASKFLQQTAAEHATMHQLAEETGGEAIYGTNGLKDALARVLEVGSNYYTLAYTPSEPRQDGSFHKVQIKLSGSGYKLAYRRGYFADNLHAPQPENPQGHDPFVQVMRRGSPQTTQILFKVRVLPAHPQPDTTDPSERQGNGAAKLKGPVVRYTVDYAVDTHALDLSLTPDGIHHGTLRYASVAYDEDGTILDSITTDARLSVQQAKYEEFLVKGLPLHQEIDLPRGEVFLRIGVYDLATQTIGSLEVPLIVRIAKPVIKATAAK